MLILAAAIAPWFGLRLTSGSPGFESQPHLWFFSIWIVEIVADIGKRKGWKWNDFFCFIFVYNISIVDLPKLKQNLFNLILLNLRPMLPASAPLNTSRWGQTLPDLTRSRRSRTWSRASSIRSSSSSLSTFRIWTSSIFRSLSTVSAFANNNIVRANIISSKSYLAIEQLEIT